MKISIDSHALLDLVAFTSSLPNPLGAMKPVDNFHETLENRAPCASSDEIRAAIRRLFRLGGFRPAGRSKPASEYLLKAVDSKSLGSINLVVDLCNLVSYHSGVPISVVDADKLTDPLRVALAESSDTYIFNASGQSIDVGGLLCLFDAQGPCANGVKDAQRTKTDADTRNTLTLIWGSVELPGRARQVSDWFRKLLDQNAVVSSLCAPES